MNQPQTHESIFSLKALTIYMAFMLDETRLSGGFDGAVPQSAAIIGDSAKHLASIKDGYTRWISVCIFLIRPAITRGQ